MRRLGEIWNKYEEIQDRLESIDCDLSKHHFRNDFETRFYDLNVKMQCVIDEHDAKNSEQVHPTDASEQGSSNSHNSLKLPVIKFANFFRPV
jgi:spore coat protein CotF